MTETGIDLPWSHPVRVADLPGRKPYRFDIAPDAQALIAIAEWADIPKVEKLRLKGEITPRGKHDMVLTAQIGATVTQECIITLEPVRTRIDEPVTRQYLHDWQPPTGEEAEMPEDDTQEALPEEIDLAAVALEALELSLPLYPRKDGAELSQTVVAADGVKPMTDEDTKPFANLRDLIQKKGESDGA
ncbi:hypothetical protein BFP70_15925 [Thioclava sp. SK-1]|uniref:YceD family protein n=1 Tax=Thioclava sp. SK-1 TaxID=1889770 RepID=UPI0008248912|nr:DUF177 domain-containing protein [Thioclava sp. SK-1]OCX60960.1 hypothetical protein BFP70_15925 [Thioclava sp. SK-1]